MYEPVDDLLWPEPDAHCIGFHPEQRVNPRLTFHNRSGSAGSENSNDGFNVLFYLLSSCKVSTDRFVLKC